MENNYNIVSYNNGQVFKLKYTAYNIRQQPVLVEKYILAATGLEVNPRTLRLTKDPIQNINIGYVCCVTGLQPPVCNGWATANGNCWVTPQGLNWSFN